MLGPSLRMSKNETAPLGFVEPNYTLYMWTDSLVMTQEQLFNKCCLSTC